MAAARLSSPGLATPQARGDPGSPIPREPRKHAPAKAGVSPPPSSAVLRPRGGAPSIACGLSIAIEAAMVAGSKQPRRNDMATIGTFKKSGNELQGEIVTLSVQAKCV